MRKLAIFSGAFVLLTAVYVYLLRDVRALWLAGAFVLLSAVSRVLGLRRVSIAAIGAAIGLLWCYGYQTVWLGPIGTISGTEQTVQAEVASMPRPTRTGMAVDVQLEWEDRRLSCILYADESLEKVCPGDLVQCEVQIESSSLSPWDGESLFNRSNGNVLLLFGGHTRIVGHHNPDWPVRLRMWLQKRIDALYAGKPAALLQALLTGDRSGLDYTTQNALSVAGLSHVVAVSGMHVSMLLAILAVVCGGSPRVLAFLGVPVVMAFALMTGASPSVCRAAVMQIMLLCAPLVHREYDRVTTLLFAALVLLAENPWAIASVSFQLSFLAVAGLFLLFEPIVHKIMSMKKDGGTMLRALAAGVASTLSATIATMPLVIVYFGLLPIASVLTNLLTLWAVTGIFTLGLLSCFFGPAGVVLAWPVKLLCEYVLGICRWIAAWPYAAAYSDSPLLLVWAVCLLTGMTIWLVCKKKFSVRWPMCGLTAAFLICILMGNHSFTRYDWKFTAMDVGQGQCLLLQIGDYTAAIDCGGTYPEEVGEQLVRKLHSAGRTRLNALIVTHWDEDHAGGVKHLLNRVKVDTLFLPDTEDESGLRTALETSENKIVWVNSLTEIKVPQGEILLYPPVSLKSDNNSGLSVLATAAEYDILVTGDLDRFGEMRLLSQWDLPEVDLLVAGHHGASTSTCQALLDAVSPETVVISVDAENKYGHPAPETIARAELIGAEILRTDQLGTIIIHSD